MGSNIIFNVGLGLYVKTITVAGQEVKMYAKNRTCDRHGADTTLWQAHFKNAGPMQILDQVTNLAKPNILPLTKAQTKALVKEHILKRQPTRRKTPMLQGGNYHPPKQEKTLRRKYAKMDQTASVRAAYNNRGFDLDKEREALGYRLDKDGHIVWLTRK